MNISMSETHFSMNRYTEKTKAEKKQIHLNKKYVDKEWNKKHKNNQIEKELTKIKLNMKLIKKNKPKTEENKKK